MSKKRQLVSTALAAARTGDAASFNKAVAEALNVPLAPYYESPQAALTLQIPNCKRFKITVFTDQAVTARGVVELDDGTEVELYVHKQDVLSAVTAVYVGLVLRVHYHLSGGGD